MINHLHCVPDFRISIRIGLDSHTKGDEERLLSAVKQTEEQDLAHSVGQTGQQWHDPVIREDGQVLLVFGYLGDGGADARQHLCVCRLEQSHDQLQPSHQGAHHFPGVL